MSRSRRLTTILACAIAVLVAALGVGTGAADADPCGPSGTNCPDGITPWVVPTPQTPAPPPADDGAKQTPDPDAKPTPAKQKPGDDEDNNQHAWDGTPCKDGARCRSENKPLDPTDGDKWDGAPCKNHVNCKDDSNPFFPSDGDLGAGKKAPADTPELFSAKDDPGCKDPDLSPTEQEWCRRGGSVAHSYPISHYGLDVAGGGSINDVGKLVLGELQLMLSMIWWLLVYSIKLLDLLLGWAFSLNLLDKNHIGGISAGLKHLQKDVFGTPWALAGLGALGLWSVWNGLVRMRVTETLGGMALSLTMMVAALVAIANPLDTVGRLSDIANKGALGVLSAASSGTVREPAKNLRAIEQGLFNSFVLNPWCEANFGSVHYCAEKPDGQGSGKAPPGLKTIPATNADLWLSYPANSPQRDALYHLTSGQTVKQGFWGNYLNFHRPSALPPAGFEMLPFSNYMSFGKSDALKVEDSLRPFVKKNPARVVLQESDTAALGVRFGILFVVGIGWLGVMCLMVYLVLRVAIAAVMLVVTLFLAPLVMLLAGFGEAGRALNVTFWKRIFSYAFQQLIYATGLGIVWLLVKIIEDMKLGWLAGFGLVAVLTWGIFMNREYLFGELSLGLRDAMPRRGTGVGGALRTLMQGYYGLRLFREGKDIVGSATGYKRWQAGRLARDVATDKAKMGLADVRARDLVRGQIAEEKQRDYAKAVPLRQEEIDARNRLAGIGEKLSSRRETLGESRRQRGFWADRQKDANRRAQSAKDDEDRAEREMKFAEQRRSSASALQNPDKLAEENLKFQEWESARNKARGERFTALGDRARAEHEVQKRDGDIFASERRITALETEKGQLDSQLATNADSYSWAKRVVQDVDRNGFTASSGEVDDRLRTSADGNLVLGSPLETALRDGTRGMPGDMKTQTERELNEQRNRQRQRKYV